MYRGIDYGMGQTNVDRETGIRFGVISQNEVLQAWADGSESVYPDPEPCDCETCGGTGNVSDDESCEDCDGTGSVPGEPSDFDEPLGFEYESEGYKAACGTDGDIFITKSPFYTRAQFCSPCAPGAVYLMNPCEDGERGYCFGHDWFEDGVAPYPVYRVADFVRVLPDHADYTGPYAIIETPKGTVSLPIGIVGEPGAWCGSTLKRRYDGSDIVFDNVAHYFGEYIEGGEDAILSISRSNAAAGGT